MSEQTQAPATRRAHRSRDNKMVAGVAGGIAEYLDIDPLLVRVTLAVLTVFGGIGIPLYALGWLLLPVDGEDSSLGESLIRTGRYGGTGRRVRPVLLAIALVVVIVVVGSRFLRHNHSSLFLLVAVVVLGVLLHRHLRNRPDPADRTPEPPQQPALFTPTGQPVDVATESMAAVEEEADRLAAERLAAEDQQARGPWLPSSTATEPPRSAPPTLRITLAALVVVLAALGAIDGLGAPVSATVYCTAGLVVVGLGLLAGAYLGGRVRWLIPLGVAFLLALCVTQLVPMTRDGEFTARRWHPTAVADIPAHYRLNGGDAAVDLSGVDFRDHTVRTTVQVGAGQAAITLPRDVDVTVHARGNAGDLSVLGATASGLRIAKTVRDNGPDGAGGGRLDLTVKVGVGDVAVHRAAS